MTLPTSPNEQTAQEDGEYWDIRYFIIPYGVHPCTNIRVNIRRSQWISSELQYSQEMDIRDMDSPMYYEVIYITIICLRTYALMSELRFY